VGSDCPRIDWISYFRAMSRRRQAEFENDLCARNLTLGEYMEIIEQASMEICSIQDGSNAGRDDALLSRMSHILTMYVRAKQRLLSELKPSSNPGLEAATSSRSASINTDLRNSIHRRIESIKSGTRRP
jgi:hypothetical protein